MFMGKPDNISISRQGCTPPYNLTSFTPAIVSKSRKPCPMTAFKDMIGIPWMLAFALRDTGWHLRNDIIWMKDNPIPKSVKDLCDRCYGCLKRIRRFERRIQRIQN